jgi:tetratricopeptide (TPR) repeat protein
MRPSGPVPTITPSTPSVADIPSARAYFGRRKGRIAQPAEHLRVDFIVVGLLEEEPERYRPEAEGHSVFMRRTLRLGLCALGVALIVWQTVRAEPTDPIPKAAKDRYAEAQELEKQGRTREAIAAYQDAIRLGMQNYPRAHLKEANGYLGMQDFDAAIAKYTKFIDNFGLEDSCRY